MLRLIGFLAGLALVTLWASGFHATPDALAERARETVAWLAERAREASPTDGGSARIAPAGVPAAGPGADTPGEAPSGPPGSAVAAGETALALEPAPSPDTGAGARSSPPPPEAAPAPHEPTAGPLAGAENWHAIWRPFRSELAASGFAGELERATGLEYRVERAGRGDYRVSVAHAGDEELGRALAAIEDATGLDLAGEVGP
jgi:hypothetical protein